jgi:hypothetical protein
MKSDYRSTLRAASKRRWASRFAQTLGDGGHPERAPSPSAEGNHASITASLAAAGGILAAADFVLLANNFPQEVGLPEVFHF